MKQTSNYQLNQWEMTDRIQMEDFNRDNETVDAALAAQAAILAQCGNCKIEAGSYKGTGQYGNNRSSLTFSGQPLLVMISNSTAGGVLILLRSSMYGLYNGVKSGALQSALVVANWETENAVTWYGSDVETQANDGLCTYYYIALTAADA